MPTLEPIIAKLQIAEILMESHCLLHTLIVPFNMSSDNPLRVNLS